MEESGKTHPKISDPAASLPEKKVAKLSGNKRISRLKEYAQTMGPGIVTGSAGNDPSGIATYSQTGAQFGYSQLWLAVVSFPLQVIVQEMCARIGMVSGVGLTTVLKKHFPAWVVGGAILLLTIANIFTIGADLGAMAEASRLLLPQIPFGTALLGFILISLFLQIYIEYALYANYLKYLTFTFLAYIVTAVIVQQDWGEIALFSLVPHITFTKSFLLNVVAVLGTTITPFMYFWQSSQAVEEEIKLGLSLEERKGTTKKALKLMRTDITFGMFFSNLIMWFIILTAAGTLFRNGITNINSAADAALALKPLAGDAASILFAIGIIGAGLLATPILAASTSYAISEFFNWKQGFHLELRQGYSFYGLIIIFMVIGSFINFIGINPIKLLYYAAVINGVIAAPIIFLIVKICSNKDIMGRWVNGSLINILGYTTATLMGIFAFLTLLSFAGVF